jgi:hypothetical protein
MSVALPAVLLKKRVATSERTVFTGAVFFYFILKKPHKGYQQKNK